MDFSGSIVNRRSLSILTVSVTFSKHSLNNLPSKREPSRFFHGKDV